MISNAEFAEHLMGALSRIGRSYAVLHREVALAEGSLDSDIDIIVDESPASVVRRLAMANPHLLLICFNRYDIGAAASFWTDQEGHYVAQLDLTYDPHGRGRYGLLTDRVLASATLGLKWPRAHEDATLAYLLAKRAQKGQLEKLLRERIPDKGAIGRARSYVAPRQWRDVESALNNPNSPPPRQIRLRVLPRLAERAIHPVGTWAHLISADERDMRTGKLARMLQGFLPYVADLGLLDRRSAPRIAALRRRPSLVLTRGTKPARGADVHLKDTEGDMPKHLLEEMDLRTRKRVGATSDS